MADEVVMAIYQRVREDEAFQKLFLTNPLEALKDYSLTEEQQLKLILPNFSWIVEGKLAGLARPYSPEAFAALKSQEVLTLLSLTEEPLPSNLLKKYGILARHLPIVDFTAPTVYQVDEAVSFINQGLEKGQKVGVHCGAGLGRTGTILACYLVSIGIEANEAIATVRLKRPGSIETAEQEAVIALYEDHMSGRDHKEIQ